MEENKIYKISYILGIASVVFGMIECFIPLVIIGAIMALAAIVIGIIGIKSEYKHKAIVSIVFGSCGLLEAIVWMVMFIISK